MPDFTTSDGLRIAYHLFGEDAARPPVVLHHGFAASAEANWVAPGVVKALTDSGRKVIAIDARGHGDSEKPHDSAFYGEARMARDVSELADHLGLTSFDLVGYSMGAIVSVIVASQEPRVRRLVIGGIGDGVIDMGGVDTRVVNNLDLAAALEAEDPKTITNPATAGFRRFAESTGADRLALAAQARAVHKSRIPMEQITAPSALIVGDKDPLASRPERLAAAVNGAALTVLPGDHLGVVGHEDFRAAIVAFVNA